MPVNVRFDGKLIVLSNFGRLLNDPRYHDASRDVRTLLEEGGRSFALDLAGIRDLGPAGLGLLMTITRLIRQYGGDAVLIRLCPDLTRLLDEMRMDSYWETFDTPEMARGFFHDDEGAAPDPGVQHSPRPAG